MRESDDSIRRLLYVAYARELEQYQTVKHWGDDVGEIVDYADSLLKSKYTEWINVTDEGRIIGFLLIGRNPNCAEGFDYFIQEFFVSPHYRHRGIAEKAVESFIKGHSGRFCMYILDKNIPAKRFWWKMIDKLGGAWIADEIYDPFPEPGCTLYGFEV